MRFVRHLEDLPYDILRNGSVVTIGSYDGLHLGHQKLLEHVTSLAGEYGLPSVVMSFEPTPKEFFQAERPPARLMRFREKYEALEASGIDIFYCPRFSPAIRQISAANFIRRILVHGLNVRRLVVGDDFRFARNREGSIELLTDVSHIFEFSITDVASVLVAGKRASSTAIREACALGDIAAATAMLGRPYRMSGKVVEGAKVGRQLGFPTANVDLRRRQSAVQGIYAVRVLGMNGRLIDGVASVGNRPTFNGTKPLLEVYLFEFDENIYGQYIHVDFVAYLREQIKYEDVEGLVAQMHVDVDNARSALAAVPA
jgi:riboflavin kinase/FMN adenylyltransferase